MRLLNCSMLVGIAPEFHAAPLPSTGGLNGYVRETTYWTTELKSGTDELSTALANALSMLEERRARLEPLLMSGLRIELYVSLFPRENAGNTLDWQLLKRLADLRVELSLDVYPPREPKSDS